MTTEADMMKIVNEFNAVMDDGGSFEQAITKIAPLIKEETVNAWVQVAYKTWFCLGSKYLDRDNVDASWDINKLLPSICPFGEEDTRAHIEQSIEESRKVIQAGIDRGDIEAFGEFLEEEEAINHG